MKICVILGTRPEIIKMKAVLQEIIKRKHSLIFVHTGQHYDFMMSRIFMDELNIPPVNYFLNVSSNSQGRQIAEIISASEPILKEVNPKIVLVQGDTNSALAASIISSKLNLPIGHVEAGCRSFDKQMSEEINRVIISQVAQLNFAPTENCLRNLQREGVSLENSFLTGHPIVDLLREIDSNISNDFLKSFHFNSNEYYLLTIHRRENIEYKSKIMDILTAIETVSEEIPVVFPCHPHTRKKIKEFGLDKLMQNIKLLDTVGYFESLSLIRNAKIVLTDSGGIQQEAAILRTPCITIRDTTEWKETIDYGINYLSGIKSENIIRTINLVEQNYLNILNKFDYASSLFGKDQVSSKILDIIEKRIG